MGLKLMPWQRHVAEIATEFDPVTGVPWWREVFVTTPRQAGKTTLILAMMLDRCLAWGSPQVCAWTGQSGSDIRRKWVMELVPSLERSEIGPMIKSVRRAMGAEQVAFQTGSRIELLPNTEAAGHGLVLDFVVLDEIFADHDSRREQSLLPAMATKRDAQMLTCSTAGTAASTVFNRKVRAGRNAVAEGHDSGMAYFEWSAPDDWDPGDDESFAEFHPAVGHTIDLSVIRQARATFEDEPGEFARAYGNKPQVQSGDGFPVDAWQRVTDSGVEAGNVASVGVDVSPERSSYAVAVCDDAGTVELIKYGDKVSELLQFVHALASKHKAPVFYDARGPAGSVEGMRSLRSGSPMSSRDVMDACAMFSDAVADENLMVRRSDALDRAVAHLVRKNFGDAYVWSRKASRRDVTPLYAATLAYAGSKSAVGEAPAGAMYVRS